MCATPWNIHPKFESALRKSAFFWLKPAAASMDFNRNIGGGAFALLPSPAMKFWNFRAFHRPKIELEFLFASDFVRILPSQAVGGFNTEGFQLVETGERLNSFVFRLEWCRDWLSCSAVESYGRGHSPVPAFKERPIRYIKLSRDISSCFFFIAFVIAFLLIIDPCISQ